MPRDPRERRARRVPLGEIKVPESRLRQPRDPGPLAESMREIGLLHPITITVSGVLVSGRHRLEAARMLGWKEIDAFVVEDDELKNRLLEIDENLKRLDLTVWEQAKHAAERERILEALGQRARRGGSGSNQYESKPATAAGLQKTTADIAREAGVSERTWQNRAKIGRGLGERTREVLEQADATEDAHRQFLNSTTQLNHLADIAGKRGDEVAAEVARRVLSGESRSSFEAYRQMKLEGGERPQSDPLADAPDPNLTAEERAYYRLPQVWIQFHRLAPGEVALAAKSAEDAARNADGVERMLDWLARYRDALRERQKELTGIRRVK